MSLQTSASNNAVPATYFVTGYPGFVGKRLVRQITERDPNAHLFLLVQPKFVKEAHRYADKLGKASIEILTGDVIDMHLGLSGDEYQRLCDQVTDIFHLAAISYLGASRDVAWRVNVEGTRNVLELGKSCANLRRLNHFSTCYVSGDRIGVIAEDELDRGQGFRNAFEETKFEAEKLVRSATKKMPITVYRPSSVVGDSKTGEIDRFEGPYYLGMLLLMSPLAMPLPLPGDGVAPLNVVPVDFVVEAAWELSRDPRAIGRTFHLVDASPVSARRAYELIAKKSNKRLPRFHISAKTADMVLGLPVVERLARPQRAALNYMSHLAMFTCGNTLELLDGKGLRCPSLDSYVDRLISYVREHYRRRREAAAEVDDPLDQPVRG